MAPIVSEKLDELQRLCQLHGVSKLWLFGSAARSAVRFDENSDLDFAVEFQSDLNRPRGFSDPFWKLYIALEDLFGRNIHLLEPDDIQKPSLREAVQQQRELIYDGARAVAAS